MFLLFMLQMWGETIDCEEDVWDVFTRYLTGEPNKNGVKVEVKPVESSHPPFRIKKIISNQLLLTYIFTLVKY